MKVLVEVPIEDIDNALRALVYAGVSVGSLDFLIHHANQTQSNDYRTAVDCIICGVLDAISEGVITRWDFDVADTTHLQKIKQQKTLLPDTWNPPSDWMDHEKRATFYGIIGCYRSKCHRIVENFVLRFGQAQNIHEIRALKKEALIRGILVDTDLGLQENHSIVDSKKVFSAYQEAINLLVRKKGDNKLWLIYEGDIRREISL